MTNNPLCFSLLLTQVNNFQLSTQSHLYGDHFTTTDRILGSLGILQLFQLLSIMESRNMVLTFERVDEILKCDPSNESY